ncbi:MAG: ATP-binding protein [Oligoflexia bacterium]|nr:ATP-binding protein [Oligoflexia bacterium]
MRSHTIKQNHGFIGRKRELNILQKIQEAKESAIVVVHGRRRVGKTELIEQFYRKHLVFKFEGLQVASELQQLSECVSRLGSYLEQEHLFSHISCKSWSEFFKILSPIAEKQEVVLYFEELQWLCSYQDNFLAEMKPFWDDKWRHNQKLKIVFSGSSPSFIMKQFFSDKALYNRSVHTISLAPFSMEEISAFLGKLGKQEKLLAALAIGGIPEYLKQIKKTSSVYLGLCEKSFTLNGFFFEEYPRIFVSSMSHYSAYKKIIEELAKNKHLTRDELAKKIIGTERPGGHFSSVLDDLEMCGFIRAYSPVQIQGGRNIRRYMIDDEYLNFYHNFIRPKAKAIKDKRFEKDAMMALNKQQFQIALGFSFERWCRKNYHLFAEILGFSAVEYDAGAFYNRALSTDKTDKMKKGFQIDLVYLRKDHKIIIAEIKLGSKLQENKLKNEISEKVSIFLEHCPKYKNYTIETLLIVGEALSVHDRTKWKTIFDHVIDLDHYVN